MKMFQKHQSFTEIARAVLIVAVVLTMINVGLIIDGQKPVESVWYVINVLMIAAPVVFLATGMKSVKHWQVVFALLLFPAVATIYQLIVGNWGLTEPEIVWSVVNTYVPLVYIYLVGSNFSLCVCNKS